MSVFENFPVTDKDVHHGKLLTVLVVLLAIMAITIGGLFVYYKPDRVKVNVMSESEIKKEIADKINQAGEPVSKDVEIQVKSSISQSGTVSTSSREEIIKKLSE